MRKATKPNFRVYLRNVLLADDGLSIESEATVYIRSLEGGLICCGLLSDDGDIELEYEFGKDVDAAIDWFVSERDKLNHGAIC